MPSEQSKRTPPKDVRDRLRREMNFGCPICRSPFLTYHHFDPPWEPAHLHNEPGMIALCSEHHNFADGGNYPTDYLRKLKQKPPIDPPKGQLPWNVTSAFISFGGNYFVTHKGKLFSFRVDGKNVFSLCLMENGYLAVNAAIYNRTNNLICEIVENDIVPNLPSLGDLTCSTQGKKIEIRSKSNDAYLSLKLDRLDESTLLSSVRAKWPETFSYSLKTAKTERVRGFIRSTVDADNLCATITIRANVYSPHVPIETLGKGIVTDFRPLGYDRAILTGFDIGEAALRFVYSNTHQEKVWLGSA
jgi:hypothetical protein